MFRFHIPRFSSKRTTGWNYSFTFTTLSPFMVCPPLTRRRPLVAEDDVFLPTSFVSLYTLSPVPPPFPVDLRARALSHVHRATPQPFGGRVGTHIAYCPVLDGHVPLSSRSATKKLNPLVANPILVLLRSEVGRSKVSTPSRNVLPPRAPL